MTEFFADPLKFYHQQPGWLFVTATLLPLLSFALIFLASGAWAERYGYLNDLHELDTGLRLVVGRG